MIQVHWVDEGSLLGSRGEEIEYAKDPYQLTINGASFPGAT